MKHPVCMAAAFAATLPAVSACAQTWPAKAVKLQAD